jgi:hypothetical protein
MNKTKIYKGLWWLPDSSDKQIPGALIVERRKITLETIGALGADDPISHFADGNAHKHEVIWGISSDAQMISVFNCFESLSLNTICPFPVAKYEVQVVAVGKHICSLDEVGNYDVKAFFEELSYWFRPNCLHFKTDNQQCTYNVDWNNANHTSIQIKDGCLLELKGEANISNNKAGMRVEIEQRSSLKLIFSKPISMQNAKQNIFIFEQFLSFATLMPVENERLLLIDKDITQNSQSDTIEIYYKKEERTDSQDRFWEYLFVYETIKESFPSIIQKWYAEKDLLPIRAHLIDSISNKGSFCSTDFLIITQAIEGYYCRFIKDGLSLKDILTKLRAIFYDISILDITDDDIVIICDSRNHYSHLLPPGKKQKVVYGHDLYSLNHKLRKLLLCCIMNFIGFSNKGINHIFSNSNNPYLRMVGVTERKKE